MKKLRSISVILLAITMILSTVPWLSFADGEGETDPVLEPIITKTADGFDNKVFYLKWIDSGNRDKRPSASDLKFKLYYDTNAESGKKAANVSFFKEIKMPNGKLPADFFDGSGNAIVSFQDSGDVWRCELAIPSQYIVETKTPDNTATNTVGINWYLVPVSSVPGYTANNESIRVNDDNFVYTYGSTGSGTGTGNTTENTTNTEIILGEATTPYHYSVQWNDNNNGTNKRPELDGYSSSCHLEYQIDGAGEWMSINDENNRTAIGMTDCINPSFVASEDQSVWNYDESLPSKYTVRTNSDSEEHNLTWRIVSDYDSDNYITGSSENHNYKYTLASEYSVNIVWQDNANIMKERPTLAKDDFKVYRYRLGDDISTSVLLENGDFTLTQTGISLNKQPEYDAEGQPYIYYAVLNDSDADGKMSLAGTSDVYAILYENKVNYSTETESAYINGDLILTLEGKDKFIVTKKWDDEDTKAERPDCNLYLYRVAEMAGGTIDADKIEQAGPVQGYDKADVTKFIENEDGSINYEGPFIITLGETEGDKAALPKYDLEGHRYIYFALEKGLSGDYKKIIDNSSANFSDEIKNIFQEKGYVVNGGEITNALRGNSDSDATKIFEALAMQNMKVAVKFTLQKYDKTTETWINADSSDIKNESQRAEYVDDNGDVVVIMNDFCSESRGQKAEGPELNKYTKPGSEIKYRWVETSMQIYQTALSDDKWTPVVYTDNADGTIEYDEVRIPGAGPGLVGKPTTAIFQPRQAKTKTGFSNTIYNKLIGETQVKITKKWFDNGVNVSDSEEVEAATAKFKLLRDGIPVKDISGDDVIISVDYANLVGKGEDAYWLKIVGDLPRYDNDGKEYEYSIEEVKMEGWSSEFEISKSVVSVNNEYKGNNYEDSITQLQYDYVNSKGIGDSLRFDVEKDWLDESDLLTRKPVTVGIFRKADDVQIGSSFVLQESNNWYKRVYIPKDSSVENDNVENYYVKEISVNGVPVTYKNGTSSLGDFIYSKMSGSGFADSRIAGRLEEPNSTHNISYSYDVFIDGNNHKDGGNAEYTITNRRTGLLTLKLTKKWNAGGKAPVATFKVSRRTLGGDAATVTTFDLTPETVDYGDGAVASPTDASSDACTVTIADLPKYDMYGNQYEYTIEETHIGGIALGQDRTAAVEGDTYLSSVFESDHSIVGEAGHHSGDTYIWSATNTRVGSDSLSAYKVWRDDGTAKNLTARPDVYFDVYRVAVNEDTYSDLVNGGVAAISSYCAPRAVDANKVVGDKIWNTQWNDWCWSCDIGSYPKFDGAGNRYIYFLVEKYSGASGEYNKFYANGINEPPNTESTVNNTTEVFSKPASELYPGATSVLILNDGKNVNDFYSRVVVNAKYSTRKLTGKKIWHLPSGWTLKGNDLPVVQVHLYRTINKLEPEIAKNHDAFETAISNESYGLEECAEPVTLANGLTSFTFEKNKKDLSLEKYDEYGRTYYYYMYETTGEDHRGLYVDSIEQTSTNGYTIDNTYQFIAPYVQVSVSKIWYEESLYSFTKDKLAPITFKLYAENDSLNKQLMATATISPDSEGKGSYTFEYYNNDPSKKLPYYGPDGKPLIYSIKEENIKGYTATTEASGNITLSAETVDGVTIHKGSVTDKFKNTYTGAKKNITVSKNWNLGTGGDSYKPNEITVTIKQSWDAKTIDGHTMPAGENKIEVKLEKSKNWTATIENVPIYTVYGTPYKYTLENEKYSDDEAINNHYKEIFGTPSASFNADQGKFDITNALNTVNVKINKNWAKKGSVNGALSEEEMQILKTVGFLDSNLSIKFELERKAGSGGFAKVDSCETTVTGNQTCTGKLEEWKNLPKYAPSSENFAEYTYRVKETVSSGSGENAKSLVIYSDESGTVSGVVKAGFAAEEATASESVNGKTKTVTFTNTIDMSKYTVVKEWNDNGNRDNTRPETITVTIGGVNVGTFTKSGNTWTATKDLPTKDSYDASEVVPDNYAQESLNWSADKKTCTITNKINVPRKTISIKAKKSFAGDADWIADARPTVKFFLEFKGGAVTEWTPVTAANASTVMDTEGMASGTDLAQTVMIGASNEGEVTWTGLYKYAETTVPGTPQAFSYRIVEKLYNGDTEIASSNYGYTPSAEYIDIVGDTENTHVSYNNNTFTNTLKTVNVSVNKNWAKKGAQTGNISDADFTLLKQLGFFGDDLKLSFVLQRKTEDAADYSDVATAAVKEISCDTKAACMKDNIAEWSGLPEYSKEGKKYSYRVKETVSSGSGENAKSLVIYSDESGTVSGVVKAGFAAENATAAETVSGDTKTVTFTNTIDMSKYTLVKKWNDNSNSDGTRTADKVTFTVNGETYVINKPSTHSDSWSLDIELPTVTDPSVYTVDENAVTGYTKNTAVWDAESSSWTITNSTDRVEMSVSADKTFTGETVNPAYEDKDTYKAWVTANRPVVQFVLYYKHGAEGWTEVTEANKADAGIPADEDAVKTAEFDEGASKSKVASWSKLYSYWSAPAVPGVPEPMSYKVVERIVLSDGTIAEDRTQYYDITDGAAYAGTKLELVNALKTTKVTAEKIWNDGDNKNRPEKIVFNLSADGTKIASLEASAATGWKAEFTDLPVMNKKGAKIKYDISEITPPGYFVSKKEVNEAGDVFKLTNSLIPPTGDVVFYKTGLMNEKCSTSGLYPVDSTVNVNGAKFELQTASGSKVATAESKDGTVKFTNVSPGTYFVKEVSAPEPYKVSDKKYKVTVSSGSAAVLYEEDGKTKVKDNTVVNDIVRADIMLTKVAESKNTMKISGAEFGLFRDGERIATATTSKDGTLKFEGLVAGKEYRIVELEAPAGSFMSKNDITFEVDKNGKITNLFDGDGTVTCDASGNMTWKEAVTRIKIIKKDKNGTELSGAKLAIKDKNTGKTILKFTTDGSAYDVTGVLEPGMSYILSELSAPTGYLKADDVSFSIPMKSMAPGDNKVIKVTMTDPYDPEYFNPDGTPSYIPDDDKEDLNQDGIPDKFQGDPNGNGGLFDDDENSTGDDAHANGTKTGDATDMIPYASLMFTALLEMICLLIYRRRRENN